MFKNRLTSRVAIVASVLIALAAITVTATRSTQFAFIDSVQEFFGTAPETTPTRTAAPLVQTGETKTSANSAANDLTYVAETTVVVDGSGNLVITDANGAASNDNITISCTSPNLVITDAANGLNESILLTSITGNITVNTLGGNDTLTLNLAGCDFIPAGGLLFNGGGDDDGMNIVGGSQGTVTYGYGPNNGDGTVAMSNFGTITYTGLEPIANSGTATDVIFNLPSLSQNAAVLQDLGGGMTRLSAFTFEMTDFTTPSGSVTINRGHVNDSLRINSALPSFPTLDIGTALLPFKKIQIDHTVTLAPDKNLTAFVDDGFGLTGIYVTGIVATGTGAVSLTSGSDIFVAGGPGITVVNGDLTLNVNQQATPTPGYFNAVLVQSALTTTGRGNIVINGKGGSGTLAVNDTVSTGLLVRGPGSIRSTSPAADAGLITIDGRSGNVGAAGASGVVLSGASATITSVSGDISINAVGGDTIGRDGSVSTSGVNLFPDTSITSTGVSPNAASITITATGGNVTSSQGASSAFINGGAISTVDGPISVTGVGGNQTGVGTIGNLLSAGIVNNGTIASTGTGANAGSITLIGTSGNSNVGAAQGFRQDGAVSTVDGDISITGTSNTCVDGCFGSSIRANIAATGDGNITITGTGGTATAAAPSFPTHGVHVRNGATVSTTTGSIDITGTGGNTTNNAGFQLGLLGTAGTLATTGGSVTVNADTIFIDTALGTITAAGRPVSLRQKTNNVAINLGSAIDTTPSTLELSDAELDRITAGEINIGNAVSGPITTSADITRAAATNMTLVSDGDVVISGGQVNTGGGTLLLDPGASPNAVRPTKSLTDVTASTLSFGSDLAIAINGPTVDTQYDQLNVVGAVNLTGVSLALSGSHVSTVGQQFVIVNNDGADAITGTFNGLAQGATIPNFLGAPGVNAAISYIGGTGNDAVITACTTVPEVTNSFDSGAGSLRQAVIEACPGSTITFAPAVTGTITLTSGQIVIDKNLTITGPGASTLAISGNNSSRIFRVGAFAFDLNKLTLRNGNGVGTIQSTLGGAIFSLGGSVRITSSVITGNSGSSGGGVYNRGGTLTILDSTISGNTTTSFAGGISSVSFTGDPPTVTTITNSTISGNESRFGGGVFNQGATLIMVNSTVSANVATGSDPTGDGGGLVNVAFGFDTNATLTNCTFTGNQQTGTGTEMADEIYSGNFGFQSTVTLRNTIVGGSTATAAPNMHVFTDGTIPALGIIASQGYNLSTDNGGGFLTGTADQINTNPLLAPLGNNGGPTMTHHPLLSSPVIDKGGVVTPTALIIDQRGSLRPYDFTGIGNAAGGNGSDIGSVEVQQPTAAGVSIAGRVLTSEGRGIRGAVVTVTGNSLVTPISVMTGVNGRYTVPGLMAGETYVVTVISRRFFFTEPSRVITLNDNVTDADFIGSTGTSRER